MGIIGRRDLFVYIICCLILTACASTENKKTKKSWKLLSDKNTLIYFKPITKANVIWKGDFVLLPQDNGILWVSAFHNPKVAPDLFVAIREEKPFYFELSPANVSVTTTNMDTISFMEIDKRFHDVYKTLRYKKSLKPYHYNELIGDTLKIVVDDITHLFVGTEKVLNLR